MSDPANRAVFLSYASQDSDAALRICDGLRADGVEVWLDSDGGLAHGDEWDAKIRLQIKECLFFIPVISAHTQARHEGYFRLEWDLAAERARSIASGVPFILPVVIDDTREPDALVPDRFRRVQWTSLPGGVVSPEVRTQFARLWLARARLASAASGRAASSAPPFTEWHAAFAGMSPAAEEKSVAVLPFANTSADPGNDYFSDGMTEEIINALAQVPDLRVAARTSSFAFKGKDDDLRTIASKLHVRHVLEGSVRKAGNRIRITAQLISAADGFHLWSARFDRELDDIFALQDEIARAIVDQLKANLAGGADHVFVKPSTGNIEAYQLYLKGRYFWNQRGGGLAQGLECFHAALALDPDYALAHTGVADTYTLMAFYGFVRSSDVAGKARAAAEKALALDPLLAEVHTARAFIFFSFERNLSAAQLSFQRALKLKPSSVPARYWYASLLVALRRFDEAVALDEEAVLLEPYSLFANVHLGWMLLLAGRTEEAARRLRHVLELDPKFLTAHWLLGQACVALGRVEEGLAGLRMAASASGNLPWMAASVGCALAHLGRTDEARAIREELLERSATRFVPAMVMAIFQSYFGDEAATLRWLEKSLSEGDVLLPYLSVETDSFSCVAIPRSNLSARIREDFVQRIGITAE